jgi:hypothetical protein
LTDLIKQSYWQNDNDHEVNFYHLLAHRLELSDIQPEQIEKDHQRWLKATALANRWFSSESARQKVSRILRKSRKDEFAIEARAIQDSFTDLERIEKALTALEARRDKAFRQIAEYGQSFAGRLRTSADRIVDAELSQLPRLENVTQKSPA